MPYRKQRKITINNFINKYKQINILFTTPQIRNTTYSKTTLGRNRLVLVYGYKSKGNRTSIYKVV